jgi:hypothetical protein
MNMTTVDVKKIDDGALDWAVAKCEGWTDIRMSKVFLTATDCEDGSNFSTDWADAGPIIERNAINVRLCCHPSVWDATIAPSFYTTGRPNSGVQQEIIAAGPSPLIAAMRCYVISKLGPQISIPSELFEAQYAQTVAIPSP